MTADVELLPCPFCGGTNVGEDWVTTYSVDSSYAVFGCRDCGARYEDGGPSEWNRRYTAARDAEIDALRTRLEDTVRDSTNEIEALRAEVERLKRVEFGWDEWLEKTEWVQRTCKPKELGRHRADVLRLRIEQAEARADRLVETLQEARDRMLGQVKWVACDCGCERDKPADAVSVAWLRASALLCNNKNRSNLEQCEQ